MRDRAQGAQGFHRNISSRHRRLPADDADGRRFHRKHREVEQFVGRIAAAITGIAPIGTVSAACVGAKVSATGAGTVSKHAELSRQIGRAGLGHDETTREKPLTGACRARHCIVLREVTPTARPAPHNGAAGQPSRWSDPVRLSKPRWRPPACHRRGRNPSIIPRATTPMVRRWDARGTSRGGPEGRRSRTFHTYNATRVRFYPAGAGAVALVNTGSSAAPGNRINRLSGSMVAFTGSSPARSPSSW